MNRLVTLYLDKLGMAASGLCAVHCALLPFVITALPLSGLSFLAHPGVEIFMIATALAIGTSSLGISFFKHHHNATPLLLLLAGFGLIATGHFWSSEYFEPILIPAGGVIIAFSHYRNWRLSKAKASCVHN